MIDQVIASTNVEPRPYQRKIVEKTVSMFNGTYINGAGKTEANAKPGMVESPTGSGKTVIGHLIAKVLQAQNPDLCVCWVAMRRNLLTQAHGENTKHGINVEDIHYTSMFDNHPDEVVKARKDGRDVLMVVDEAQHDSATSMAHLHNLIKPKYILGLTATPFRTDRIKLCFDKVVKDAGIHQLIQDGYLSQFDHYTIPRWDVDTVADFYSREPERWGKSIFYFLNTGDCSALERVLQSRKAEILNRLRAHRPDLPLGDKVCEVVLGSSREQDRERQLSNFREGRVPCLINCMVLTEGFDDPTLESAFVRDSGKGPTMQMAGRAFRQHPKWKNEQDKAFRNKKVVQSRNTKWPIIKTAMADQQVMWRGSQWYSLTVNPHLAKINSNTRAAIARSEVTMPKFITKRTEKKAVVLNRG